MTEYEFTLKFRLPTPHADPEACLAALAEAGCDDALVGIGQPGRIALDFTRAASTAQRAVLSAVDDVQRAIPGAALLEASPDFVGLTDVAELVGCSRQNIRKIVIQHIDTFPDAVHEGTQAIWHLRPVLDWFVAIQQCEVDPALLAITEVTMKLNIARQARRLPGGRLPADLGKLFA